MHRIPEKIEELFRQSVVNAKEILLNWSLQNNIEELDCSYFGDPKAISSIVKVIAESKVHTVNFRGNELGVYGSETAVNLMHAHSKWFEYIQPIFAPLSFYFQDNG